MLPLYSPPYDSTAPSQGKRQRPVLSPLVPLVLCTPESTVPSTPLTTGAYTPLIYDLDLDGSDVAPGAATPLSPITNQVTHCPSFKKLPPPYLGKGWPKPGPHPRTALSFKPTLAPIIAYRPLLDARGHPFDPVSHFATVHTHRIGMIDAEARWHHPSLSHQTLRGVKLGKKHGDDVSPALGSRLVPTSLTTSGDIIQCGIVRIVPQEGKWKSWELDRIDQITYVGLVLRDRLSGLPREIHIIRQHPDSTVKNVFFMHKAFAGLITEVPLPPKGTKEVEAVIDTKGDALDVFKRNANEDIKQNNLQVAEGRTYVRYYQFDLRKEVDDEVPLKILFSVGEGIKGFKIDAWHSRDEDGEAVVVMAGMKALVVMPKDAERETADEVGNGLGLQI